jgi:hypothetical protein
VCVNESHEFDEYELTGMNAAFDVQNEHGTCGRSR